MQIDEIMQSLLQTICKNMATHMGIKDCACVRCFELQEEHEHEVAALNKKIKQLQHQVALLNAILGIDVYKGDNYIVNNVFITIE